MSKKKYAVGLNINMFGVATEVVQFDNELLALEALLKKLKRGINAVLLWTDDAEINYFTVENSWSKQKVKDLIDGIEKERLERDKHWYLYNDPE